MLSQISRRSQIKICIIFWNIYPGLSLEKRQDGFIIIHNNFTICLPQLSRTKPQIWLLNLCVCSILCTVYTLYTVLFIHKNEAIRIVPDFTISAYGCSCICLFLGPILAPLLSLSIYWHLQNRMRCKEMDGERKGESERPKKRDLHELPYTEFIKSGTISVRSSGRVL